MYRIVEPAFATIALEMTSDAKRTMTLPLAKEIGRIMFFCGLLAFLLIAGGAGVLTLKL